MNPLTLAAHSWKFPLHDRRANGYGQERPPANFFYFRTAWDMRAWQACDLAAKTFEMWAKEGTASQQRITMHNAFISRTNQADSADKLKKRNANANCVHVIQRVNSKELRLKLLLAHFETFHGTDVSDRRKKMRKQKELRRSPFRARGRSFRQVRLPFTFAYELWFWTSMSCANTAAASTVPGTRARGASCGEKTRFGTRVGFRRSWDTFAISANSRILA